MSIFKKGNNQKGMSYVELIVVLSIFSILSGVVIYNYGKFQSKVDIKNLASDIALKIVEAQKSSLSGKLPQMEISSDWKPSYGVYFSLLDKDGDKSFIYFTDINQDNLFDGADCTGECLEKTSITKNNTISSLDVFYEDAKSTPLTDLAITFSRPSSSAVVTSSTSFDTPFSYVQITITSPNSPTAQIKVYPSGRIQVN
jgi:prepilin-type N-terminal cleavage/methylation domain-containing protein